ncbi:murein hydrolase activator EnvC family protein [Desulfurispira natronophila]|uniref:Septal ring factor EnvC (AmiA/AmiB activator) n=1 Tax=Desulfurispira natronophila TaxID=682562 RepID=A0A7W8DG18_9BACT|nr:peptidoglycan DD-metalloendopeptidase family protein [Desulfurispira natronophila]MBB5020957.1 septal ring factor EnvC (AmiA/AmiB activator) [Desulfurispira natronophila]
MAIVPHALPNELVRSVSLTQLEQQLQNIDQQIQSVSQRIGDLVSEIARIEDESEEQEQARSQMLNEIKSVDVEIQNLHNRLKEGQRELNHLDKGILKLESRMELRRESMEHLTRMLYRDIYLERSHTQYMQSVFSEVGIFLEKLFNDLHNLQQLRQKSVNAIQQQQRLIDQFQGRYRHLAAQLDELDQRLEHTYVEAHRKHRVLEHLHAEKEDLQLIMDEVAEQRRQFYEVVRDFQEFKGYLSLPVDDPYSMIIDDEHIWLDLKNDARVYCIFDGEVVYNGLIQAYNNVVIISHGNDYYTVYGGMVDVIVSEGDRVYANELLGSSHHLFFEIRHRSQALPPHHWILMEDS